MRATTITMRQGPVPRSTSRTAVAPPTIRQRAPSVPLLFGRIALALAANIAVAWCAQAQSNNEYDNASTATNTVLDLKVGATRSDNVRRTADNEVEDTLATIGLVADIAREGTRLDYSLESDLAWTEYLDDSYDGLPVGYLDGIAKIAIVPERFRWEFRDTFDQAIVDPLDPLTPDNVQSVNYFTTGPEVDLPLTASIRFTLGADYSIVTSSSDSLQATDLDSERYSGLLMLIDEISTISNVYVSADTQHIDFEDSGNADYDSTTYNLGYRAKGSRTTLLATAGYTDIGGDSDASGGWVGRFELGRRVSPASTLSVYAAREIGDATNMFRAGPD